MPTCHGCGAELTPDNDSEAHIIPNALGGRLSPRGLICRACNALLDRLADNPLIEAFGPWPTLIDVPRDHGENPPVLIDTADGQKVRVERDGKTSLAKVVYDIQPVTDGHKVSLGANNWKVVNQLIGRAKKQFPHLDTQQAIARTKIVQTPATAQWRIETNFGPQHVIPAAFAALWLFFLHKTGSTLAPWERVLEVIKNLRSDGTFRYLPEGLPGLAGPDVPISHKIVLRTIPASGQLIGYIEILATLKIGGVLAEGPKGEPLELIYVADVFAKTDRSGEYKIDAAAFDGTDWNTIGIGRSQKELLDYLMKAQAPLQAKWESRLNSFSE